MSAPARHLRELGMAHVLIVTDAGVKAAGLLNGVYASLNEWEIAFDEISDVKANPRSEDINQAAQLIAAKVSKACWPSAAAARWTRPRRSACC
ncbi:iron-containing alcohol dehydrogenase [Pseudomonas aeruginosa]|nr:iron-containing alcohol dehydrogenase [Pseudomonas aeruginosa]